MCAVLATERQNPGLASVVVGEAIVKKEVCERLVSEVEQSFEKMGLNFYEVMKRAPEVVERWKKYYALAQELWKNATNREQLTSALLCGPDPDPREFETWLAFLRAFPHFLRGSLQGIAKTLPPPPGGRPRGLTPQECADICEQIGQLFGKGVELTDAKKRMAQRYGVSLRTIQRAWQHRVEWKSDAQ